MLETLNVTTSIVGAGIVTSPTTTLASEFMPELKKTTPGQTIDTINKNGQVRSADMKKKVKSHKDEVKRVAHIGTSITASSTTVTLPTLQDISLQHALDNVHQTSAIVETSSLVDYDKALELIDQKDKEMLADQIVEAMANGELQEAATAEPSKMFKKI